MKRANHRPTQNAFHSWVENETNEESVMSHECVECGEAVDARRWALGIYLCMPCGEANAKRRVRCVVPLHKSNYILVTDLEDLKGINNKGGFYR